MAGKPKENPLLFTANTACPFDNISTLLAPPMQQLQSSADQNQTKTETSKPENLSQSLQPHLEKSRSVSPSISTPKAVDQSLGPTTKPPTLSQGSSFLRRPGNKYVVPPEISSTPSPLPPKSSLFSPQSPPPPALSPFVPPPLPPSHGAFVPTNDHALAAPDASTAPHSTLEFQTNASCGTTSSSSLIPATFDIMASNPPSSGELYHPVIPHWFHSDRKPNIWKPFSFTDSLNLEEAFRQGSTEVVSTDGGRYDVSIQERLRTPVYWKGGASKVRRCSWFRRSYSEAFPVPYPEDIADKLEAEYKDAMLTGSWHRQVELPDGERVMLNSPLSMHHYHAQENSESPNITVISESQYPQTVRRGADDFEIKEGASDQVDHLLFLIHGIGSVCDLSFRSVEECVDDFRAMGEELLASHFKEAIEMGKIGRVEILPISWHEALHGDATGLDEKLKQITLRSIPKFREFTNDTLLDVLFYTSPVYCQHIMDTVASQMDHLLALFQQRNPAYNGGVSVGGHSLGSVILFDLLMHQKPLPEKESNPDSSVEDAKESSSRTDDSTNGTVDPRQSSTSQINFQIGVAGTGQPAIIYPQLSFSPEAFFLMGSPVGMFITVRGIDALGPSFQLPTCKRVFNIFHPFDPVAYRLETLIEPTLTELRPVLIPHHKGRKRMHLELKDTIERVGSDLKNKIVDSIQATWNKFYHMYAGGQSESVKNEVDQAVEEQMRMLNQESVDSSYDSSVQVGQLNRGFRVDYVLQEKPYESFTEYIFALQAHVTYWNSEDTLLMILKELYNIIDISSDSSSQQPPTPAPGPPPHSSDPPFIPNFPSSEVPTATTISSPAPPPVPLFSPPPSSNQMTLPPTKSELPRTLRGRPVFDPLTNQISMTGMDPTASPSIKNLPPPPIAPNVQFNHTKKP